MSLEAVQRNGHHLELGEFVSVGEYGIPALRPTHLSTTLPWISFNRTLTFPAASRERYGVNFFLDDYVFERVWRDPTRYAPFLSEFAAVMAPDFSMFTDWPMAVQIYNHWRKHQLAAYWQSLGLTVIPTICWSDERSLEWCFDGEPIGGTVAVSSVGTQKHPVARENFRMGYEAMMDRLKPDKIVFFGTVPDWCTGNIEPNSAYYATLPHAQSTTGLSSKKVI